MLIVFALFMPSILFYGRMLDKQKTPEEQQRTAWRAKAGLTALAGMACVMAPSLAVSTLGLGVWVLAGVALLMTPDPPAATTPPLSSRKKVKA